jgi:tetratricopeptide (TPR) repeat protein
LQRLLLVGSCAAILLAIGPYAWKRLSPPTSAKTAQQPVENAVEIPSINREGIDPAIDRAIDAAQARVRQTPQSASAWGQLGQVLLVHEYTAQAASCLERAAQLDPGEPRWAYHQGLILRPTNAEAAVVKLEQAVQLCGDTPDAPRLHLAELLAKLDRLAEAETHFQLTLKRYPDHPRALLGLGRVAFKRNQFREAVAYLEKAVGKEPDLKSAHSLLAEAQQRLGNLTAADQERLRAAQLVADRAWPDPFADEAVRLRTGLQASLMRAAVLERAGRFQEVVTLMQQAVQDYPDSAALRLELGVALLQLRQFAPSEAALLEAIRLAPRNSQCYYRLGACLIAQEKFDLAQKPLSQAIVLRPDDASSYYALGYCLAHQKHWQDAIDAFQKAVRYKPDYVEAHVQLGRVLAVQGHLEKAWEHLLQAKRLQPSNVEANRLMLSLSLFQFSRPIY